MLDNYEISAFACGHKTSFFQIAPDLTDRNIPENWAKNNINNEIIPNILVKHGYLHLFPTQTVIEESKTEIEPDLKTKEWSFYSNDELKNEAHLFPKVSLALRHQVEDLPSKLAFMKELLASVTAQIKSEEMEIQSNYEVKTILCSQTGKDITNCVRYYASYLNNEDKLKEITLSEEAFAQISNYDYLPLAYFRFTADTILMRMPEPVDLSKIYDTSNRQLSFFTTCALLYYNNKKVILELLANTDCSGDNHKKMFTQLLKNGSKHEKLVHQFYQDNGAVVEIQNVDTIL